MSEFTKDDLNWLDEHGFKNNGYGFYDLNINDLHIRISAGKSAFFCRAELFSTYENNICDGETMADAIKKCTYRCSDMMAKMHTSLDALIDIAGEFIGVKK